MRNVLLFVFFTISLTFIAQGQFTVGGTAFALGNNCFRLTNAQNSQAGYVYQNAPLNLSQPFDYQFSVNMGTNNGGADGIVFVLRDSLIAPFIGTGGGALGFQGLGFTEAVGVEVDTWFNGGNGDLAADHIGIISNASASHTLASGLAGPVNADPGAANIEDGNWHFFNVVWDPTIPKLTVYFDCDERVSYTGNLIDSVFGGDPNVYFGFVGTTGGASNVQSFCFTIPIDSHVVSIADTAICAGQSVTFDAGNTTPTYTWSNGGTLSSTTIPNPVATPTTTTTYTVTSTHACDTLIDTAIITIIPPGFSISDSITEPSCFGDCDGAMDLTIDSAGTYTYLWNTSASTQDLSGLCAGQYWVVVQQSNGCSVADSFTVGEPAPLTASIGNATKTSCPSAFSCDASALASGLGGTMPYTFLWSTGEVLAMADSLCPDSNHVTVTDVNGCTAIAGVDILVPDSIVTQAFTNTTICKTQNALITGASTGGTAPYSYVWYTNSLSGTVAGTGASITVDPLSTTNYIVQSMDTNGCLGDTGSVIVTVLPYLNVILPETDTVCPDDTITLSATATGGDGTYSYAWSNGSLGSNSVVSPDLSQWFMITISDVCGTPDVVDSVFVQVGGYPAISATIGIDEDSICKGTETFLVANGVGGFKGATEFEYQWSHTTNDANLQFIKPSQSRSYVVTITDQCLSPAGIDTLMVFVKNPQVPSIRVSPQQACAWSDVEFEVTNWNPRDNYFWTLSDGTIFNKHKFDTLVHRFDEPGCYGYSVFLIDDFGCETFREDSCAVVIHEQPEARFVADRPAATTLDPILEFTTLNEEPSYYWEIDGRTFFNEPRVHREVPAPWGFDVFLIVTNDAGCRDTATEHFDIVNVPVLYLPNSFTPNGDGLNDTYGVEGEYFPQEGFDLRIYDRWGHEVFRTLNPNHRWDGKTLNGTKLPQGVYQVHLQYIDDTDELQDLLQEVIISKSN